MAETAPLARSGDPQRLRARCCVVGGGPAGMMLGLLLARAGIDTIVLEKHADFLRDFRGDTVHPSTLQVMDELGLIDGFLRRPHQQLRQLAGEFGDTTIRLADFSHLRLKYPFIAFMPQWDFLDFLAEQARRYPSFRLLMQTEATGLLRSGEAVTGVVARGAEGPLEIEAALTVACDGRHSTLRARAGLTVEDIGAPIDVLWFRVRKEGDSEPVLARIRGGRMMVTLDRGDYWQCAFVIAKGQFEPLKAEGLDAFRRAVAAVAPMLVAHVGDIASWDDVKLLTVRIDRLTRWTRPGFLCIGDAAHAMSPVGGVGVNLAVQDAVASANLLAGKLTQGGLTEDDLDAVRRRRLWPTRLTQAMQRLVQNRVVRPALAATPGGLRPPLLMRVINASPWLQGQAARLVGVGVRPEHVRSPDAAVKRGQAQGS
jgi:2-polyprenyl-6-methoxyphenol hydroxylase-like FAD-dependent oxidoreductase